MRIWLAILGLCLASPALAVGTKPGQLSGAQALKQGQGAVVVSIRSEIFLPDALEVYFLREGGSVAEKRDVIRFTRKQSMLAISNDTTDYVVRSYALAPGRYRLIGYGVGCPAVPSPGMVCAISINGGIGISRPSRGYAGETPSFEVEAGKLTMLGDLLLAYENAMLWSPLPDSAAGPAVSALAALDRAAAPAIPDSFVLKRAVRPASMFDNFGRRY